MLERISERILEALEHAETEMRYAGWGDKNDLENVGRLVAYTKVKEVLEELK